MKWNSNLMAAALACLVIALPSTIAAQPVNDAPRTGPASEASPLFQRHHAMAGIMQDMVKEMSRMQEEMAAGPSTPQAQRDLAARMKRMARMMQRMSGWADRPTMNEPQMRRQYEQMKREMEAMSRDGPGSH